MYKTLLPTNAQFVVFHSLMIVTEQSKQRMVQKLKQTGRSSHAAKSNLKMEEIEASEIHDFVSIKSMKFFKALTMYTDFLSLPPLLWLLNVGYIAENKK